ncbi:SAVED domain-containing protein (plasmid) [Deinococcus metallilatus]|uniref:SAVED domain-containing protein n=1 Tax=Deinococcus metallilatus TaxID=1211322 RepID=A0AAJ5F910_9DEIO|nr:SAVED domain-containing protein [Deinococcus metallilatus]MBB5293754.1 hypothetical protein [Deinococcus metallilatus]QBY07283.1 SAVED domain-containing protein [Deinococcus metallilatus]RXJ14756.1 SAVED domain-containing protein [Deinococcus metallilatus]TLK30876.1 SAVED domain-containing protein [Deinococcus metallilatus]GMA17683.1 hypothetical protein GCM10025871_40140 [Deinococcus metallilatus]
MTWEPPKTITKEVKGHTNLNEFNTIRLWVAAGGRCEICNDLLTESPMTFEPLNRAERAHIVGQGGPKAPRHHPIDSRQKADSIDNIMLLCFDCHHEIDSRPNDPKFSTEALKGIKQQHEERIWYLTSLKPKRTHIVAFRTYIQQTQSEDAQQQVTNLDASQMRDAVLPDFFPDQAKPSRLTLPLTTEESPEHWAELRKLITRRWAGLDLDDVEHLSIFCLGKMPAIAYFGSVVGSTRPLRVMNVQDGSPTRWKEAAQVADDFTYEVDSLPDTEGVSEVVLCLSMSGLITTSQFGPDVPTDTPVIHIRTPERHRHKHFLIAEKQLKHFRREFSLLLSAIQSRYGQNCIIHLLMAAPTPIVFEVGRQHQKNHHPPLRLYNCVGHIFSPAFDLKSL